MHALRRHRVWVTGAVLALALVAAPVMAQQHLVIAQAGEPDTLDPPSHTTDFAAEVMRMIFEHLVRFAEHKGSLEIEPALATSWEQSDDGLTWTFDLRQGVTFHDGTPFNADAVTYFFNTRVLGGDQPRKAWPLFGRLVDRAEKLEDHRVAVHLKQPHSFFLQRLAHQGAGIGSPAAHREHGDDVGNHPAGTGPFRLVEAVRGSHITLEANPDYWRGAPALDKVTVRPVREAGTRALQLEAGQIHATGALPDEMIERLEANPDVSVNKKLSILGLRIDFNTTREPLGDVRVRRALNYALDKEAIAEFLYGGTAVVIPGAVSPMTGGYTEFRGYGYDPDKARALLTEAGYPDGFEMTIWGPGTGTIPKDVALMETIQSMFAEVGVTLNIEVMEWSTISREARQPREENKSWATLQKWPPSTGEATWMMQFLTCGAVPPNGSNRTFWCNPVYDDLLNQATSAKSQDVRDAMLRAAQLVLREDAPLAAMVTPSFVWAERDSVSDLVASPLTFIFADENTAVKE